MYFIQEVDKQDFLGKLFGIVKLDNDKIILPVKSNKISKRKAYIMLWGVKRILNKGVSKKLVLSNKIKDYKEFVNLLYSNEYEIVDGKWLFSILSSEVIDYIVEKKNLDEKNIKITILINDLNEIMLENIKKIVFSYKNVNIVTNHTEKFKNIEKQFMENDGIMITVGNNKRKHLSKSDIILNVDFPTELINKYAIYENAIIVNLRGNVNITKKRFNGICINDYEIEKEDKNDFDYDKKTKYKLSEVYEGSLYKKQPYKDIKKRIKKDKVRIKHLIGKHSIL